MTQTTVHWLSHASVIVRHGEDIFLCDPWYNVAFSSWTPFPPPAINQDVLIGLADKLKLVISHGHGDHYDEKFLKQLGEVESYVPDYKDKHMQKLMPKARLIAGRVKVGNCYLQAFESVHSAVIVIETPDAVVIHGNDVYQLSAEITDDILRNLPPLHEKPRFYMGQGGSASGWPLRYRYTDEEKKIKSEWKRDDTLRKLCHLATKLEARALPYACFARATYNYTSWLPLAASSKYANALCMTNRFVEMVPGDTYIPATNTIIAGLPTFDSTKYPATTSPYFGTTWGDVNRQFYAFMRGLDDCANKHNVRFAVVVNTTNGKVVEFAGKERNVNHKTCYVAGDVMRAVLLKMIPFTDLSTGYLAEWSRSPDVYNAEFLIELENYGYEWQQNRT